MTYDIIKVINYLISFEIRIINYTVPTTFTYIYSTATISCSIINVDSINIRIIYVSVKVKNTRIKSLVFNKSTINISTKNTNKKEKIPDININISDLTVIFLYRKPTENYFMVYYLL